MNLLGDNLWIWVNYKTLLIYLNDSFLLMVEDSPVEENDGAESDAIDGGLDPHAAVKRLDPVKQEEKRDVENAFSEDGADERFARFAHGLELNDHGIGNGHHRHGDDHATEEGGRVLDGLRVFDENPP